MRLSEELILLLLNEESGYMEHVGGWNMACAMAGSVLADLALEYRIDTDLESLTLLDSTPTGDELLDPVLEQIAAEAPEKQTAQYWIEKTADRTDRAIETALKRLVENNILDHDSGGFWSLNRNVSRTGVYPPTGGVTRQVTKSRIFSALLDEEIPDPRDVLLVSLVAACDAFRLLLTEEEFENARDRIDLICKMDLVGQAIGRAIEESRMRPARMHVSHSKPIPRVRLSGLLGNRNLRRGDLSRLFTDMYLEYGPVFRIQPPFIGRGVVVLAGPDTNAWINQNGRYFFRTRDHMADLEKLYGASRTMPGMDGAEHFRMRKSLRASYSRKLLEARLDELYRLCRTSLQEWRTGDVIPAAAACQKHISLQISNILIGVDTTDYLGDLLKYQHRSLVTHVQRALPKCLMHTPSMRKKRRYITKVIESIYEVHTPAQRRNKPRDVVDYLMDLHAADPQFLPETDMRFPFVAALIASIYMGSGLSFALYCMATHPDIYRRVQEQADALFANGDPDADDLTASAIDVANRVYLESQRLYPVIPMQIRTVMNHCILHGFDIPKDTRVVFGHTAAHHIEECFSDPARFDIERFSPPREEHKKAGAYVPFGLGTHRCLGSRLVELQMAVNLMLITHYFNISIVPSDYEIAFNPFPTSAPNKKLKFRIDERRNGF